MAKLATGRHEMVGLSPLLARRHRRRGVGDLFLQPSRLRPAQVGSFVLPAPDPYRSRFIGARRGLRLALGAGLRLRAGRPAVDGRAGRLHRRADPELRRRAGAAGRLHGGSGGQVPRARHAADLRRGADRASAAPAICSPASATASCRTSSRCRRRWAPACRWPPCSPRPRSRTSATSAASCSTPRTPPIRCRPPSASRCWRS